MGLRDDGGDEGYEGDEGDEGDEGGRSHGEDRGVRGSQTEGGEGRACCIDCRRNCRGEEEDDVREGGEGCGEAGHEGGEGLCREGLEGLDLSARAERSLRSPVDGSMFVSG